MMMVTGAVFRQTISTSRHLYKYLMRTCEKLPKNAQKFYKHSVKQSFKQHIIEPDPERVKEIMQKALSDAEWIMKKYKIEEPPAILKK